MSIYTIYLIIQCPLFRDYSLGGLAFHLFHPDLTPTIVETDSLFIPNLYSFSPHPLRKASLLDGTRTMRNFLNLTALLENLTDRHCRRTRTVAYSRAAILSTGIPRHDSRRFPYIAQLAELSRSEQFHRLEISRMLLFFQIAGFGIIRDVTDMWYCSIYNVSGSCFSLAFSAACVKKILTLYCIS